MAQELMSPRRPNAGARAVPVALGGMLGAGIFVAVGPAFAAAGWWSLLGVPLAALVAGCCALATAHQAAVYQGPGPAYSCIRARVGVVPARMSAAAHIAGHLAALAAIAGLIGDLLFPASSAGAAAVTILLAVLAATAGLRIRAAANWLRLGLMLAVLALVVAVCFAITPVPSTAMAMPEDDSAVGITGAAGVFLFAFLGLDRVIAAADEQDRDGRRAVRRTVVVSLVTASVLLLVLAVALLHQLGPARLALSPVPVIDALGAAAAGELRPVVSAGIAVALLPVLLGVLESLRSTALAAVRDGDLPAVLARTGPAGTPFPLDLAAGAGAALIAALVDPVPATAFASCAVLVHFAFTNAGARLSLPEERTWAMRSACLGMGLSVVLAMSMPVPAMLATLAVVILGPVLAGTFSGRWS
ncbi:amino acid permease [Saccharopolyspora taberi]|uniref:Amino acid permease n=1 Tax=Saccharopolyspora taberi TaxID=60895 RepID=A0ABN3VGS1_9PSEU